MAINVDLDDESVIHAKIGQMMIDNPELSYEFVREALLATKDVEQGMVTPYVRKTKPSQ
jgi:hypothetical protein